MVVSVRVAVGAGPDVPWILSWCYLGRSSLLPLWSEFGPVRMPLHLRQLWEGAKTRSGETRGESRIVADV